jgi:DNA (cytosine-5)-methyltransferase 1
VVPVSTFAGRMTTTHTPPLSIEPITPGTSTVSIADIRRDGDLIDSAPHLVAGGPPCQPFSTAGARSRGWNGVVERLSFEFIRIVAGLRPPAFVMENVPGMAKGVSTGVFNEVLREMQSIGYAVEVHEVDAHCYGVPQQRKRLIFIGMRADLGIAPPLPAPSECRYGVRDAVPGIARLRGFDCYKHFIDRLADLPLPTLTATRQQLEAVCEDGSVRPLTIADLKRLCSFPDDFVLDVPSSNRRGASEAAQWRRLGNAVPPLLALAIGRAIRAALTEAGVITEPQNPGVNT